MGRILLVDDEPLFLERIKPYLEGKGYSVETAPDGKTALEKVRQLNPVLILLDVMMPGLSGFEVLAQLKMDPKVSHIQVVMLTAKGETESIRWSQQFGAVDYLVKPFSPEELLKVIKNYVL